MSEWLRLLVVCIHDGLPKIQQGAFLLAIHKINEPDSKLDLVRWMIMAKRSDRLSKLFHLNDDAPYAIFCRTAILDVGEYFRGKTLGKRVGRKVDLLKATNLAEKAAFAWVQKARRLATKKHPIHSWPFKGTVKPSTEHEIECHHVALNTAALPGEIAELAISAISVCVHASDMSPRWQADSASRAAKAELLYDLKSRPWEREAEALLECIKEINLITTECEK